MTGPRRAPRILVAPQEFKGSLDAGEAARAIAAGVHAAWPDAEVIERPMSDGGPGTAALVAAPTGGTLLHARVRGALGDPVDAAYAWLDRPAEPPMALVESATAVGLLLTPAERRDPALASTEGVGELVLDAARRGVRRIVIGCGGTGTSDGGSGLARALGLRLLDAAGLNLPPGAIHLVRLHSIERPTEPPLRGIEVIAAVDVQNTLTGPAGAVAVYGRQKSVADWQAPALDAALARWADVVRRDLGREIEHAPGAGAGGGLPAGLLAAVSHARIESGAALVARAIGLAEAMRGVDLVITGEGALDAQTAHGKAVAHVAALAAEAGVPCLAVAGRVLARPSSIRDAEALVSDEAGIAASMRDAAAAVTAATESLLARQLLR